MNLLANDGQRLAEMIMFSGILLGAPVMLIGTTIFGCLYIGWTALIGIIAFTSFIPLQVGQKYVVSVGSSDRFFSASVALVPFKFLINFLRSSKIGYPV